MAKLPRWLESFEMARSAGYRGFIITGNTNDIVFVEGRPSPPPCQVKYYLAQYLAQEGFEVYIFSLAYGLQQIGRATTNRSNIISQIANPKDMETVLNAFTSNLRRSDAKIAFMVDYADHLAPPSQGMNALLAAHHLLALQTFHSWGTDDRIKATDNLVVLISHEDHINELLRRAGSGYYVLYVELPDESERLSFTNLLLNLREQGRRGDFAPLEADITPEVFAKITGGLRLRDIEGIFRQAASEGNSVTRELVRDIKATVIKQLAGGLLEVQETEYGMERIAGMPHLKDYIFRLKWRWQNGASDLPQAILLAGVPGCGKSYSVKAIAKELSLPCLVMRNIREQWVGASERNLERVLHILESLAPCLVWIDELDQVMGQRSTGPSADAGTSERMMARLWEFMGSMKHRGSILWVATTNRPDLLDPATLDRFPVVIPLIHPSPAEVVELLPMLAAQVNRKFEESIDLNYIAFLPCLELPTIRGLQEIVVKAGELADAEAGEVGKPISHRHLEQAAKLYKPNYNPLLHQFIALTALRMTTFQSLLPWRDENGKRADYQLPSYLEDLITPEGDLDSIKLNERLNYLQQQLQWERIARQV